MTDTELLNGLQRLFSADVVALRSCRSGVKIDLLSGGDGMTWTDQTVVSAGEHRDYFGSDALGTERFGMDIRTAIRRAIEGEGL